MPRFTYVSESELQTAHAVMPPSMPIPVGSRIRLPGMPSVHERPERRRERQKKVKAGRPAFFSDPDIDRLLAITVRLMTEHSVLTEQ